MIEKKQADNELVANEPQILLQFNLQNESYLSYKFINQDSFIARTWSNKGQIFKHISRDGKVLSELQYYPIQCVQQFLIVSDHRIVILQKDQTKKFLIIWNFIKNSFHKIPIKNLFQTYYNDGILFFKQSQVLCYWDRSKQEKFQLTYFKLSEIESGIPFHEYVCQGLESKGINRNRIAKLNQKSIVGFFYKSVDIRENLCVNFYDLDLQRQNGVLKKFQISISSILNIQKTDFLSCRIIDIWQASPQLFYIQIQTYINNIYLYKRSNLVIKSAIIPEKYLRYHALYHNLQQNKTQLSKINIPQPHRIQFINTIRQIQYTQKQKQSFKKQIQQTSAARKAQSESGMACVPIFYVEPDEQRILMMNRPIKQIWDEEYCWSGFVSDKMYKINHKRQRQEITIYQFPPSWLALSCGLRILSVDWMAQYVQQCCDDLLELVYNIL